MEKPKATYFISPVGISITESLPWLLEQTFSNNDYWNKIPFGWLTICFLVFFLGQLVQDMYIKDSWLRKNIRLLFRKFDIDFLVVNPVMNPRSLEAKLRIKYIRDIKQGSLIMRVHHCVGLLREVRVEVARLDEIHNVVKGETMDIVIATVAIMYPGWEPFNSTIGPPSLEKKIHLVPGTKNIVEIELKTGVFSQSTKVYIENVSTNSKDHPYKLYVQSEEKNLFQL